MDRRSVRGVFVVLAVVAIGTTLSWRNSVESDPMPLVEALSDRIGWRDASTSAHLAADVFERVNDERRIRGLAPVVWHEGLAATASVWSETMIDESYEHSTAEFRAHPDFAGTGENIAMGQVDTAELHIGWMRSDGHRANILHPGYTALGVGIVCRNDGRMWATQIFGQADGRLGGPARIAPPVEPVVGVGAGATCPS